MMALPEDWKFRGMPSMLVTDLFAVRTSSGVTSPSAMWVRRMASSRTYDAGVVRASATPGCSASNAYVN